MAKRIVRTRKAFRQGELLFVPLSKEDYARLFGNEKDVTVIGWQKLETHVIREGEATGHKHEILTKLAVTATLFAPRNQARVWLGWTASRVIPLLVAGPSKSSTSPNSPKGLPRHRREYDEARPQQVLD
jgi:hypothetical protein